MVSATQLLTAVGALVVAQTTYSLLRVLAVYFGPSRVGRYLHGPHSYALITGATDGIGKGVAHELYKKGFNLILHGRNEEKLKKVVEQLKEGGSGRDIRTWIADANRADVDFAAAAAQWEGLEITLVVHNVGSAPVRESTIDGIAAGELLADIQRNDLFPLLLTRAVLPQLRRAAGPTQLVFVGSLSSAFPIPRIVPYGATKAFLRQLSAALGSDEAFRARRTPNVTTLYMDVGSVASNAHKTDVSLMTPAAEAFAKHFVHCIGCGRASVIPYWPHALQTCTVGFLPDSLLQKELFKAMEAEMDLLKKH